MSFNSTKSKLIIFGAVFLAVLMISMGGKEFIAFAIVVICGGIYWATKKKIHKEDEESKTYRMGYKENSGVYFVGRNEHLENNPPPAGEYWKNVPITRSIVKQIFDDMEFPQAWMLVGYGSQLARKRLELNSSDSNVYVTDYNNLLNEIANEIDFDSALISFIDFAKTDLNKNYFPDDFPPLLNYLVQRDLEKSFSALEDLLDSPIQIDKDQICRIIGEIDFPEWNKLASDICIENKMEYFEPGISNNDIADELFQRKAVYFGIIGKNIPVENKLLCRYHVLMEKANCS